MKVKISLIAIMICVLVISSFGAITADDVEAITSGTYLDLTSDTLGPDSRNGLTLVTSGASWGYPDTSDNVITVNGNCLDDKHHGASDFTATISGLNAGQEYMIYVTAVSVDLDGESYDFAWGSSDDQGPENVVAPLDTPSGLLVNNDGVYELWANSIGLFTADVNGEILLRLGSNGGSSARTELDGIVVSHNYYPPFRPIPENGASQVPVTHSLSWSAALSNVSYDVYLDPDEAKVTAMDAEVLVSENQGGTDYVPTEDLAETTTYYWRVVSKSDDGTPPDPDEYISDVWSFTTFVVVRKHNLMDFDRDGIVSLTDLGIFSSQWLSGDVPVEPESGVNICDYGALGDGLTLNTTFIQTAIDNVHAAGGGRVLIPPGTFLSGGLRMKDSVELHISKGATLLASTNRSDYSVWPKSTYPSLYNTQGTIALLYAEDAQNISLTGGGTIDGQGAAWTPGSSRGDFQERPRIILFISCNNICVKDLRLFNSPMWLQHYLNCEDLAVHNLYVYNHSNMNNDAIDIDGCRRVTVSDCNFDTDDDGITIKSTGPAATENVVITNCVVSSHCNAIKFGTESSGGFRNVIITNCTVVPSVNTTPMFGYPGGITGITIATVDGGIMEGINISNVVVEGPKSPLYIRLGNRARKYDSSIPTPEVAIARNITISNAVFHGAGTWGCSITGIPGHYIENITLSNVQFTQSGGIAEGSYNTVVSEDVNGYPQPSVWGNLPAFGLYIRHVRGLQINGLTLGCETEDSRVPVLAEDVSLLSIDGSRVFGTDLTSSFLKGKDLTKHRIETPLGWEGIAVEIIE